MKTTQTILRLALPTPLARQFDYLPPENIPQADLLDILQPGMRLHVPFGRSTLVGILLTITTETDVPRSKLKPAIALLDDSPIISRHMLELLIWAAGYYHHPVGQALATALPGLLRKSEPLPDNSEAIWLLTDQGLSMLDTGISRAPKQQALLTHIHQHAPANAATMDEIKNWRGTLRTLIKKDWVETRQRPITTPPIQARLEPHTLNDAQQLASDAIIKTLNSFKPLLLEGITGSGKTEVYLTVINEVLKQGKQALVLVPEIGLTPQLVARFKTHFGVAPVVLNSALNDKERLHAWQQAANGQSRIIIGTRSAIFTPMSELGIIIIDEEHDGSFKQQDGFRYHARDLAIVRAQRLNIPVVLGSATPSLETLHNARLQRYQTLSLPARHANAALPKIGLIDCRRQPMNGLLSKALLDAARQHLQQDHQVLLFLNRRGYSPTLLCHDCGWVARCQRCDAHLIYHHAKKQMRCHHCDATRPTITTCPECKSTELRPIGYGTERLEEQLMPLFPDCEIVRIDRDNTRNKKDMENIFARVKNGKKQILLGTQMLAKGHDLPNITLVGILDADQGLFGIDFRASERMAQLTIQVAGRAGRADKPGTVLIQTHQPEHPLLQALVRHDYPHCATMLLDERQQALLPPYSHLALFRAEAVHADLPMQFLEQLRHHANQAITKDIYLLGPAPAIMERRAGRYRAQLMIQATQRNSLHHMVQHCLAKIQAMPQTRQIRWSIDIDPQEMF